MSCTRQLKEHAQLLVDGFASNGFKVRVLSLSTLLI
jgi:hypothetical protein